MILRTLFCLLTGGLFAHAEVPLSVEHDLAWLPKPNVSEWIITDQLPTDAPITGSYVLARFDRGMLIAEHRERGWDIPGGHVDPGETPAVTAARETLEETGATVTNLQLIAVQRLHILGSKPDGYKYPYPTSYQALYVGDVTDLGTFAEEEDSVARAVLACDHALARVGWIRQAPKLRRAFARALRRR